MKVYSIDWVCVLIYGFNEFFQCIYYCKNCVYGNDFIIDCEKLVRCDKLFYGML